MRAGANPAAGALATGALATGDLVKGTAAKGSGDGDGGDGGLLAVRVLARKALAAAALVAAAGTPGGASGGEDLVQRYRAALDQCYGDAGDGAAREACIGVMSDACFSREPDGESTLGMSQCLYAESEVWDELLNAEYRRTMAWAGKMDRDEAAYFPEYAVRADRLRAAQRAWIAFRDAECGLDYAIWGSGSMRNIAGADCIMRQTAERVIALRSKRETFE